MFTIVRIKGSTSGRQTALLSDGRSLRVSNGQSWGDVIPAEDIVDVDGILYHKSIAKVKPSKPKERDYYLCRDLNGYDAKVELAQIKNFVSLQFRDVMNRGFFSEDEFEEVSSYCAEACVRRHVFEKYNPDHPGSYTGYLKTIVFNLLRDYRRKKVHPSEINCLSLNHTISGKDGDSTELIDFVASTGIDVSEHVEQKILLEKLSACVTRLDKEGTGLPGFTYKDLFDIMVNGEPLDKYLASFKFPRKLLDEYVLDFKEQLKEEIYSVWCVGAA